MSYTNTSGLSAADVAAVTNSCNNGNGFGWGGDGAWWLLVLFLFAANGNGFGNNGGYMPYAYQNTNSDVQRGFDQQALINATGNISSAMNSGFSGVNQSLCNGFAGVNATVTGGFNSAEIANNSRQIANMNQMFALQTGLSNQLNTIAASQAQCCCDNRLATANLNSTIMSENCADRTAISNGVRDIMTSNSANTQSIISTTTNAVQSIMDKICQLELNAKNDKIADLQNQLTMAQLAATQTAQTATLMADHASQTYALEKYLNPPAIPAYVVPNPNCCNTTSYATPISSGCCGVA